MRVSVVVPVYNPGHYIGDLIESLRAQTLDPAEFEAIFVDDGSTDDTPALLDRVAEETPNLRVIHIPNSGWPGKPRNIGIDAAQGDYVFLSDHDDRLDPEALQRLADFADEHGSDVVVGRIVGVGRNAPDRIFERTVVDAQQDPGLLMSSLTPQKLYRRAFLDAKAIRFPEGKRRLEDHLFVTKAYLRADRVSIYADHPVYYFVLRDDGKNASRRRIEWDGYFANAAESIAVVDAEAPDEATRIVMRARWLRTEALTRLRGRRFVNHPDRDALLAAVRRLVEQHYTAAEVDRLQPAERLIGRLLLDDREADVLAFAQWEASLSLDVTVTDARIDAAGRRFAVDLAAEPLVAAALPESLAALPADYPAVAALEAIARIPRGARVTVRLRLEEGTVVEVPTTQALRDGRLTASATLDLDRRPALEAGRWRVRTTIRGMGKATTVTPLVTKEAGPSIDRSPTRAGEREYKIGVDSQRRLLLRVERVAPAAAVRRVVGRIRKRLGV